MNIDLFSIPTHDPLTIARKLDKLGNEYRVRIHKRHDYQTVEHKAAQLLRWYAKHGMGGARVADQAKKLVSEAQNDLYRAFAQRDLAKTGRFWAEAQMKGLAFERNIMREGLIFWRRMAFVATCLFVATTGFLTFVVVS